MIQEDKELLLIDLCARLPYEVKYCRDSWNYEWDQEMSVVEVLEDIDKDGYINYHKVYKVWDIKPYLRPMSSMTEEEKTTYKNHVSGITTGIDAANFMIWVYKRHLDIFHFIEKGLAIEAPEGMYK